MTVFWKRKKKNHKSRVNKSFRTKFNLITTFYFVFQNNLKF